MTTNNANDIVIYQDPDGKTALDVHLDADTVWLNQKQMAELFGKDVRTVNEHVRNIFREGELQESAVIRKFRITASDVSRRRGLISSTLSSRTTPLATATSGSPLPCSSTSST